MTYRVWFAALAVAAVGFAMVPSNAAAQVVLANVRVPAEIDSVDRDNRTLMLRGPSGNIFERRVPDEMQGFGARQPGETVTVTFLNQIAIHLRRPGAALPDLSEMEVPPGVPTIMRVIETEVIQIDTSESAISLKAAAGPDIEATFRLPAGMSLSDFAVGDRIDVAYVFPEVVSLEGR